jgi:hypothetical protein
MAMAKRDITQREDMPEQMSMNLRDQDLLSHQPAGFKPNSHLSMYAPTGGDPNAVRFTKNLPKTMSFNPITGHLRDTATSFAAGEPNPVMSSLAGPTKQQINFSQDYAGAPAF